MIFLVTPSSHAALANQIHRSHSACTWLAGWPVMLLPLFKKQSRLQWQVFQWESHCCCPATRLTLHLAFPHTIFYTTFMHLFFVWIHWPVSLFLFYWHKSAHQFSIFPSFHSWSLTFNQSIFRFSNLFLIPLSKKGGKHWALRSPKVSTLD